MVGFAAHCGGGFAATCVYICIGGEKVGQSFGDLGKVVAIMMENMVAIQTIGSPFYPAESNSTSAVSLAATVPVILETNKYCILSTKTETILKI
ncbi:hypothetical protein NQ317_001891 [Molorchus minor]|uniref:Uncharacterized protein n=1 Tax=Molorchus minor TaxID=1323400 RepID=A0ABQ9J1B2_9CUCU|nr:hypothetical protein NQ317_001891 [Molorchus minor]